MQAKIKKTPHFSKKIKIIASIAGILATLLIGWWMYTAYTNSIPHPLGNKLEYLGKKDFGGELLYHDYDSYSIYYYATDMSVEEVISYFKKSSVIKQPDETKDESYFGIKTPSGETIYTSLYNKDAAWKDNPDLPKTSKKYILEIPSFKYQAAKDSL